MPKLISVVFVLLTLLFLTSLAAGQQAQPAHRQPRDHMPYAPSINNGVQVWAGIDLSHYSTSLQSNATGSMAFSDSSLYTDIVGVWSAEEIPGLVLTLLLNGNFSLATSADLQKRCSSGVERGSWALLEQPGQLLFRIKTDTNGTCGLSGASMTVHKTETHLMVTTTGREVLLVRR